MSSQGDARSANGNRPHKNESGEQVGIDEWMQPLFVFPSDVAHESCEKARTRGMAGREGKLVDGMDGDMADTGVVGRSFAMEGGLKKANDGEVYDC